MSEPVNVTADATATPSATPAPATSGVSAAAATATPSAAPASGAIPQTPEGMVPSYRLREQTEQYNQRLTQAQQQWAQKEAELNARHEAIQKQLHALVGATPQGDPEVDAIRQQFQRLYPGLAAMEEHAQELMALRERAGDLEYQNSHYWDTYGRSTMDRLFDRASQTYGTPLSLEGKRALHAAFTGWVSQSPELAERYAMDPTVVDEFWKNFTSSFIDPARRVATAAVATNTAVPLPKDTPGGAPRATPAPQLGNLDDRAQAAWTQYTQLAKER